MKRKNKIKLNFVRNWSLPGKERLAALLSGLGYTFYQVTQAGCELAETPLQIKSGNLFCISN